GTPFSQAVQHAADGIVTLESADDDLRYRALVSQLRDGYVVVTAAPLGEAEDAIRQVLWWVLIAGLGALALAALGSSLMIRRGLAPIDRIIDTASASGAGDLSQRVAATDQRTELGRLGSALNDMLGQIERSADARAASEERLRRFVADAAHELRTPLTSLRGYAELYRQGALTDDEAIRRGMGRIEAEDLEDDIFRDPGSNTQEAIFGLKKDLLFLRRVVAPERDVLYVLVRRDAPIFTKREIVYFQDVYDHLLRITDAIDVYRDLLASALDASLSMSSYHLNVTVKRMTSSSIILMSMALISGIYGMNFVNMPELNWYWGYAFALGLMVVVGGSLALFFKRIDWL
ncbi:MAG: CorA family divalent cation transporter, partial [Chloroflexota bacterium]